MTRLIDPVVNLEFHQISNREAKRFLGSDRNPSLFGK
jgi:hypothetical protein